MVVGRQSRVRGVPFFNGEILAQIVTRLRLFRDRFRAERVFVSRFGQRVWEDVLILSGQGRMPPPAAEVIAVGTQVGENALRGARTQPHADVEAIDAAIAAAPNVGPSPMAPECA